MARAKTSDPVAQLEQILDDPSSGDVHDLRAAILESTGEAQTHEEGRRLSKCDEAVTDGDLAFVQKMLKEGMDPNQVIFGETVLVKALRYHREDVVELLLKAGADPNKKSEGYPPLMRGVGSGRLTKMMLDAGAEVEARGKGEGPVLAIAAAEGDKESVAHLLAAGAKVDARCKLTRPPRNEVKKCTALFGAALFGDVEIVRMLLDAGADPRAVNEEGETPLDWARLCRNKGQRKKVVAMLEGEGAAEGNPVDPVVPQDLDFRKRCKTAEYREALARLEKLAGAKASPLQFENAESAARGGYGVSMPKEEATTLVAKERRWFAKQGCTLFYSDHVLRTGGHCVALLPTTDLAEVFTAVETTGANSGVYTEDIVKWFRELEKEQPFELHGTGMDFIDGRLTKPPKDARKLAKRMVEFCPDLVGDSDAKAVKRLTGELTTSGRVSFWWD